MSSPRLSFGAFEFSPQTGDLWKHGYRLKLQPKPQQVLAALLEANGETVSREELRRRLWAGSTFVDFDQGLNVAVKKLRDALGDSADEPHFIETVPGQGYRWMAEVQPIASGNGNAASSSTADGNERESIGKGTAADFRLQPEARGALPLGHAGAAASAARASTAEALRPRKSGRWIAAAVLVLSLSSALWWKRAHPPQIAAPSWVLIANFENRTGEPVLDGTLEYALERELSNSQFVKVASQDRINDALRLMKKPPDTRLDAALAREACLRDGEIATFVTGRIEKIGGTYVLSAEVRNAGTGVVEASFTEQESQQSRLAPAVRRISNRVRETLGEQPALIQQSNDKLEKVTTPSLYALQLYSRAEQSMEGNGDQRAAETMLREAIKTDPDFASAYILLAWAIRNQRKPRVESDSVAAEAFRLSERVPDRERYFIQGSYYQMAHRDDDAARSYRTLLALYPDHFWAANNLPDLGTEPAVPWVYQAADLRPKSLRMAAGAWEAALAASDDPAIQKYRRRADQLATPDSLTDPQAISVILAPVIDDLSRSDTAGALAKLNLVEEQYGALEPDARSALAFLIGNIHCYLGELRVAEEWFRRADPGQAALGRAEIAYARGEPDRLRNLRLLTPPYSNALALLAVNGDRSRIGGALTFGPNGWLRCADCTAFNVQLLHAELQASGNDHDRGMAALRALLQQARSGDERLTAANLLAHHLEEKSDMSGAAAGLEAVKGEDLPLADLPAWATESRFHLAELYRRVGRTSDAEKVEADLRKQLMFADADHPILLALKRRESDGAVASK